MGKTAPWIYPNAHTRVGSGLFIGHAAHIGNNVYTDPSCCLIEPMHSNHDATIGAGSMLTRDTPAATTATGTPGKC